jgi:hypothetical protein
MMILRVNQELHRARCLHRDLVRAALSCCFIVSAAGQACAAGQIDVLTVVGDTSPDGSGQYQAFGLPALNDAGQIGFVSQLSGTAGGTADNIAWVRLGESTNTTIARKGISSLDGDTITSHVSNQVSLDEAGRVHGVGSVAGPPSETVGFVGDGATLMSYARFGDPSPSGNNALQTATFPSVNDQGVAAFQGIYSGTNAETGIYSRPFNGALTTRLLSGAAPPGIGTVTLNALTSRPTINESGQIAVRADVNDGMTTRRTILRLDGTTVVKLAREGDVTGSTTISSITSTLNPINDSGQVAFVAQYTQPAVSRTGVFLADDGGISLVAPGLLPGSGTAASVVRVNGMNNAGQVALYAEFGTAIDPPSGIYLADEAGPMLIAFEDTLTPAGDKYFRRLLDSFLSLNESGQLVFSAELSDTANGPLAGRGLFFYDPDTGLEQIIRTGSAFMGSTFTDMGIQGPGHLTQAFDTSFSGFNNSGQVAFFFSLANGTSGLAIWTPDTQLPGDFNSDGAVDAADYVVWRKNPGGIYTLDDFNTWRANFGNTAGAGTEGDVVADATVPEPKVAFNLCCAIGAVSGLRVYCRRKVTA